LKGELNWDANIGKMADGQLSTVHRQLSTVNRQPPTAVTGFLGFIKESDFATRLNEFQILRLTVEG
jgi:hypothetical protein